MQDNRLGAILLENGLVDEAQLERALTIQTLTGGSRPLGQILVEQRLLDEAMLQRLLQLQRARTDATPAANPTAPASDGSLLGAAVAAGAVELVVAEGRPARLRTAAGWQTLGTEPLRGPEVWDVARETMGGDVLEELAEHHFVVRSFAHAAFGGGTATAFRQFDGISVRLTFVGAATGADRETIVPAAVAEAVRNGRGLVLAVGERGRSRSALLAELGKLAAANPAHYVLVLDDEPRELPAGGARIARRRFGVAAEAQAAALRAALREDPDALVIADVGCPATFELALRAAEAGRLVIGYLDAPHAAAALQRLLDFYPEHDLPRVRGTLAAVLRAVLVRHDVPAADRATAVALRELLLVDDAVRDALRRGDLDDLGVLLRLADGRCGHSLDQCLLDHVLAGRLRVEDAIPYAESRARLLAHTGSPTRATN